MNDKKDAKNTSSYDPVQEEPFGYRVAQHKYLFLYYICTILLSHSKVLIWTDFK